MNLGSKILGLLLVAALLMATRSLGTTVADHAPSEALDGRPAGCHAAGGQSLPLTPLPHYPPPAPVSYQCCLTGHGAAVMPASASPQPPAQCQYEQVDLQIESVLTTYFLGDLEVSMVLSAAPPGTTPLRI